MAKFDISSLIVGLLFFVHCQQYCKAFDLKKCEFNSLYQLGDASGDTGNYIREGKSEAASAFARLPYGQNFVNKTSTGRCSNGLLILDYLAIASGLPFIDPDRKTFFEVDFKNGDTFATAGATALPDFVLKSKNISSPLTSTSLDVQFSFMFTHFNGICLDDCIQLLKNSLFIVGDIGTNDYSFALLQGKTINETTSLVSDVVFQVEKAIRNVINLGPVRVVVPGIFPLGCLPMHLTKFGTKDAAAYDEFRCLKYLNDLSRNHNQQLQRVIEGVKKDNPKVTIVYGDYYNAYISLLRNAQRLGFDVKNLHKACCGIGGEYNFDFKRMCGAQGVPVCAEPNKYISWDGINLSQQANEEISQLLIQQILPKLNCKA